MDRHRWLYDVCPYQAWREWTLTLACGVALVPLGIPDKAAAHELAAALAGWPVDWTAPEPVLREWSRTSAQTSFRPWLQAAVMEAATRGRIPPVPRVSDRPQWTVTDRKSPTG